MFKKKKRFYRVLLGFPPSNRKTTTANGCRWVFDFSFCFVCRFFFVSLAHNGRARFVLTSNATETGLKISRVRLSDQAVYRCEITYLEINEGCPVVQYADLTVIGSFSSLSSIVSGLARVVFFLFTGFSSILLGFYLVFSNFSLAWPNLTGFYLDLVFL